jgi:hypothetical protein
MQAMAAKLLFDFQYGDSAKIFATLTVLSWGVKRILKVTMLLFFSFELATPPLPCHKKKKNIKGPCHEIF